MAHASPLSPAGPPGVYPDSCLGEAGRASRSGRSSDRFFSLSTLLSTLLSATFARPEPRRASPCPGPSCAAHAWLAGQSLAGPPSATLPCGDTAENVLFLCNGAHSHQDSFRNRLLR